MEEMTVPSTPQQDANPPGQSVRHFLKLRPPHLILSQKRGEQWASGTERDRDRDRSGERQRQRDRGRDKGRQRQRVVEDRIHSRALVNYTAIYPQSDTSAPLTECTEDSM